MRERGVGGVRIVREREVGGVRKGRERRMVIPLGWMRSHWWSVIVKRMRQWLEAAGKLR